jgi:hypothetical protein
VATLPTDSVLVPPEADSAPKSTIAGLTSVQSLGGGQVGCPYL